MFAPRVLALPLLALCFLPMPAGLWAQTGDARLEGLGARLEKASEDYRNGGTLSMEELNELADELEAVLREMRQMEREYSGELSAIEQEFYDESEELMRMIGFITTFESQPAPDYILHPEGAMASVQANIIVEGFMRDLKGNVADVAARLSVWRDLKAREDSLQNAAQTAFLDISDLREDIIAQERDPSLKRRTENPMVLDALYAVSSNLNDFVDGLEQIDMDGAKPKVFSMEKNRGKLDLPVEGTVVPFREGIHIETQDPFVETPVPATVRFVAEFLDYGNMVILEPERDFLLVIAGMDSTAVKEGDILDAGEVIGFFDAQDAESSESESSALRLPKKTLYVETRKETVPVNVMEYFHPNKN